MAEKMKNNLIFNNEATFSVCYSVSQNAPNMIGGSWRSFHINGVCSDVVNAVNSGISRREYESYVFVDEDTNTKIKTYTEDLSDYTIISSVVDHLDGTVTVWARKETELEKAEKDLGAVSAIAALADLTGKNELILNMPVKCCVEWEVGKTYPAGKLVSYDGVKYLVQQQITAAEHQPPNMKNGAMLAVYKPYQGRNGYQWVYGEYCEVGFTRFEGDVLYRAIQNPNANIYPPSQIPAIWEIVE